MKELMEYSLESGKASALLDKETAGRCIFVTFFADTPDTKA